MKNDTNLKLTVSTIKEIVQSTEYPLFFAAGGSGLKIPLFLCRYLKESSLQGAIVPKGSYLLADQKLIDQLNEYGLIEVIYPEESITAFILPYCVGKTCEITVDDDSTHIIVTPPLTGCTITAELGSSKPKLLHSNIRITDEKSDDFDTIDQLAIDREISQRMMGKSVFTLKKNDYIGTNPKCDYAANFIGLRENNEWSYYSQYIISIYLDKKQLSTSVQCGKKYTSPTSVNHQSPLTTLSIMGPPKASGSGTHSTPSDEKATGYRQSQCRIQ